MRILVTGSNGFLGSNIVKYFSNRHEYSVFLTSHSPSIHNESFDFMQGDLSDPRFVDELFSLIAPNVVINTVSLVNVDRCEEEPLLAYRLTVKTAELVAQAAKKYGCRLIYISTDHLFDGKKSMYTEKDIPEPVNVYGKMKVLAERMTQCSAPHSVIVRTNFFGWSHSTHAQTFGEWVYSSLKEQKTISLFTDYFFTPIEVSCLIESIEKVILSDYQGIINIAGLERCSKYDFGLMMAEVAGFSNASISAECVKPGSFKAPRQQDLSLSTDKYRREFNGVLPTLRQSIERNQLIHRF